MRYVNGETSIHMVDESEEFLGLASSEETKITCRACDVKSKPRVKR